MSTVAERIAAALTQVDEWVQPAGVPGVGIAVVAGGDLVAERYAGMARSDAPVGPETLFGLASVTKPLAAAGVLAAVEDGYLDLDEPIARYAPEFLAVEPGASLAVPGRSLVTVRDLLRHTGGLAEDIGPARDHLPTIPTLVDLTRLHLQNPSIRSPAQSVVYSNSGLAILAPVVAELTGEEFWSWTRRRVQHGDRVTDLIVRPTGPDLDRLANLTDPAHAGTSTESYNSEWWRTMALPWGGAYGTPRAAAAFAAAFLDPEDDTVGLSWASRRAMTSDQTVGLSGGVTSGRVWWESQSWGLGWEVRGTKRRHWTGELTSPSTFCHFGQAGTLVWADPALGIAVAVFTNRSVAKMWGFILSRWLRLGNAIAAAV